MLPSALIARALSRLLSHDANARALLTPHVGETLQVRMPPLVTTLTITEAGDFVAGDAAITDKELAVSIEFPLTSLPLLAQGKDAALRSAKVSGHAALLQDISKAFSSLPLAAEAELERVVGPILAQEALRFFKALKALGENTQESLQDAGKRYLHDEAQLIAERDDVARFASDIQRLRVDLQRLQARVAKLSI